MAQFTSQNLPKLTTLKERFFSKVDKQPGEDGCWVWTADLDVGGYGRFWWDADVGVVATHIVCWTLLKGRIPPDAVLDHLCKNRACCRPEHLQPITQRENTMRGAGITAQNARLQSCRKGHPFTPENTYRPPGTNSRQCRECMRAATRRFHASHPGRVVQRMRHYRERKT